MTHKTPRYQVTGFFTASGRGLSKNQASGRFIKHIESGVQWPVSNHEIDEELKKGAPDAEEACDNIFARKAAQKEQK